MKIKVDDVHKQKELLQREKEDLQHHYQSVSTATAYFENYHR